MTQGKARHRPLQDITLTRPPSLPLPTVFGSDTELALDNYDFCFSTNNNAAQLLPLLQTTVLCNKSCDHVDILKMLRPAL